MEKEQMAGAAWDYVQEKLAVLEAYTNTTYARFHTNVIDPFSKLLEKKVDYYLRIEKEKGEGPGWLADEIEAMDRLLRYCELLESHADEQLAAANHIAHFEFLRLVKYIQELEHINKHLSESYSFCLDHLINIHEKCPHKQ